MQLFEFEDFGWFPRTIRDPATDYLHFVQTRFALHRSMVPILLDALQQSGRRHVLDLCTGGGGPILAVSEALAASGIQVTFTLTDRYPNLDAFRLLSARNPLRISYSPESIDAVNVPAECAGLRTMFNAFHHFAPAQAHAVLACAVEAREPIVIFEIPERALTAIIPLLFTPIFVAVATIFIRPFSWRRFLWTYVLPVVPLVCWWDGLVSQCRAYTVPELLELTQGLDDYDWKAVQVGVGGTPGHITCLTGLPKRN